MPSDTIAARHSGLRNASANLVLREQLVRVPRQCLGRLRCGRAHHVRDAVRDRVCVIAIGADHDAFFDMYLGDRSLSGRQASVEERNVPRVGRGAASAKTHRPSSPEVPGAVRCHPTGKQMVLRSACTSMYEKRTCRAASTSAPHSRRGIKPRRKSGLNSASRSSTCTSLN